MRWKFPAWSNPEKWKTFSHGWSCMIWFMTFRPLILLESRVAHSNHLPAPFKNTENTFVVLFCKPPRQIYVKVLWCCESSIQIRSASHWRISQRWAEREKSLKWFVLLSFINYSNESDISEMRWFEYNEQGGMRVGKPSHRIIKANRAE